MLYGVRLLINQIIPAFQGIAEKVVPGAKPALMPILFNYRPNAVIIGFIVAMITSTILVVIANTTNVFGILIVPLVITSFFECGGCGDRRRARGLARCHYWYDHSFCRYGSTRWDLCSDVLNDDSKLDLDFGGNDLSLWGILGELIGKLFGGF